MWGLILVKGSIQHYEGSEAWKQVAWFAIISYLIYLMHIFSSSFTFISFEKIFVK